MFSLLRLGTRIFSSITPWSSHEKGLSVMKNTKTLAIAWSVVLHLPHSSQHKEQWRRSGFLDLLLFLWDNTSYQAVKSDSFQSCQPCRNHFATLHATPFSWRIITIKSDSWSWCEIYHIIMYSFSRTYSFVRSCLFSSLNKKHFCYHIFSPRVNFRPINF